MENQSAPVLISGFLGSFGTMGLLVEHPSSEGASSTADWAPREKNESRIGVDDEGAQGEHSDASAGLRIDFPEHLGLLFFSLGRPIAGLSTKLSLDHFSRQAGNLGALVALLCSPSDSERFSSKLQALMSEQWREVCSGHPDRELLSLLEHRARKAGAVGCLGITTQGVLAVVCRPDGSHLPLTQVLSKTCCDSDLSQDSFFFHRKGTPARLLMDLSSHL